MKSLALIFAAIFASAQAQCPSGFIHHGDSCYAIPMAEGSWVDGMMICEQVGGELAVIETASEQTFIEGFLRRYGSGLPNDADFWVGGGDFVQEGRWVWVRQDTQINPTFWAPSQPNNRGGPQGCLRISAALNYKWEDGSCNSVEYALCERPFRTE